MEDMCRLPTSFLLNIQSRQTGSGHAADSKMRYTIQFSILMLCAKYMEDSPRLIFVKGDKTFCNAYINNSCPTCTMSET